MTVFGPAIDVRPAFPRERQGMIDLLQSLGPADWAKPTICPGWDVHDVVGHVLNDYMRRLSGSRDGHSGAVFADDETLPAYVERTNADFVSASRQLSPRLMVELLQYLGPQLDALWANRDLAAPADLNVSWASTELKSPTWLDLGREFTEFWVHQQQVRDAVDRPGATEASLMAPVLEVFSRALPHTLRWCHRPEGTIASLEVIGSAGGRWAAGRYGQRWQMVTPPQSPATQVTMDQDTFWRLATRGISVSDARERTQTAGDAELAATMTTLLAVIA